MKRILVIGDVIADVYRHCTFKKMCPDAPYVKAVIEQRNVMLPGGAANVAMNIAELAPDVTVSLIGVMRDDLARIIKGRSGNRVNMDLMVRGDHIVKQRIVLDGQLQIRVDSEQAHCEHYHKITDDHLEQALRLFPPDLIVVSDYAGGTLGPKVWERLLEHREKLLVDTKRTDLSAFGADGRKTFLIKLNNLEWQAALEKDASPERFFENTVVTRSSEGANLYIHEKRGAADVTHMVGVNAHPVTAIDPCGCGDTFLAGLAASVVKGHDTFTAVQFANAAAACVVTERGTAIADLKKTLELLGRGVVE